jgi:hypothetical protein
VRTRRSSAVVPLAAALLLLAATTGTVGAAGNPKATFDFSVCQTTVPAYDENGDPIGDVPALEMFFSWSNAYVDTISGSWTRTDGGDVLFGFSTSDFTAGRSGTVDAGSFTIQQDMPELDGIMGSFSVGRHTLASRSIAEPGGGWTAVAACA